MKLIISAVLLMGCLTGCQTAAPQDTTSKGLTSKAGSAAQLCHDYVWFNVPKFEKMPNAAVSAFPSSSDGGAYVIFWNVSWDDPRVRAAGSCTVANGEVTAFEDYTE